jgi:hypothetical protein
MIHTHRFTNVVAVLALLLVLIAGTGFGTGHIALVDPAQQAPQAEELLTAAAPAASVPHRTGIAAGFATSISANLKKVYVVAREVGHPETLQAILLLETRGGKSVPIGNRESPVGKRSYGLMQVQVVAARSILQRNPSLFKRYFPERTYNSVLDEEIIALLLTNDEANIRIAAHHFKLYLQLSDGDWDRAVAAYNVGIGGVENIPDPAEFEYVIKIKAKLEEDVRPFNRKNGLLLTQRS